MTLLETPSCKETSPLDVTYHVVTDDAEVLEICEYLASETLLALDTETYGNGIRGPEAYYSDNVRKKRLWISDPWLNHIRLVQIRSRESDPFLFDLHELSDVGRAALCDLLGMEHITWIGHNLKFDYRMIAINLGVKLARVFDTMIARIILGFATGDGAMWNLGVGLKDTVRDLLDIELSKEEQGSNWGARELTENQKRYAANDLTHLYALYDMFVEMFAVEYEMTEAVQLEMDVLPVVCDMELAGIHLDEALYWKVQKAARAYLPELEKQICEFIGHPMTACPPLVAMKTGRRWMPAPSSYDGETKSPLDSNPFMLKAFRAKGIPLENLQGDHLEGLADRFPILDVFSRYRDLSKQLSMSYVDWVHPVTGRIHTEFNQSGAATARFTASNPNLQQVPKMDIEVPKAMLDQEPDYYAPYFDKKKQKHLLNYRYCFVVSDDTEEMASADFSGQEVCVMVALSGDPNLIEILWQPEYIEDPSGKTNPDGTPVMIKNMAADIHAKTAELMWGVTHGVTCWTAKEMEFPGMGKKFRDIAKTIVFGNAYGKSEAGMANDWGITKDEAKKLIDLFFKPYPKLKKWLLSQGDIADETRMSRFGIDGTTMIRWRMVNSSRHTDAGALKRAGMNTPIQGTSALMMKKTLVELTRALKGTLGIICGTVHDEVLVRYPLSQRDTVLAAIDAGMKAGSNYFLRNVVPDKWSVGTGRSWTKD